MNAPEREKSPEKISVRWTKAGNAKVRTPATCGHVKDCAGFYIHQADHAAAIAAARAEAWNAAINAAADEAEEHKHFAKGILCCADCIRLLRHDP